MCTHTQDKSCKSSYLKGRGRLSLSVPVAQERRHVELGDGGRPAAGPDLEGRNVSDRGQVDVEGPELGDVYRVDYLFPGEQLRQRHLDAARQEEGGAERQF